MLTVEQRPIARDDGSKRKQTGTLIASVSLEHFDTWCVCILICISLKHIIPIPSFFYPKSTFTHTIVEDRERKGVCYIILQQQKGKGDKNPQSLTRRSSEKNRIEFRDLDSAIPNVSIDQFHARIIRTHNDSVQNEIFASVSRSVWLHRRHRFVHPTTDLLSSIIYNTTSIFKSNLRQRSNQWWKIERTNTKFSEKIQYKHQRTVTEKQQLE